LEAKQYARRKKKVKKGRGRPKYLYYALKRPSPQWGSLVGVNEIVQIAFRRLRHACRYKKGASVKKNGLLPTVRSEGNK